MKPHAKYIFKLPYFSGNKFVIHEHIGTLVPDFTPEIIIPMWSKYKRSGGIDALPEIIILGVYPLLTLYYVPEMPDFTYGSLNGNTVLAKFERDRFGVSEIKIWFFNKEICSRELYDLWISCQLELN